jgi:ferredoxin
VRNLAAIFLLLLLPVIATDGTGVEESPGHRHEKYGPPTDMGLSLMEIVKADGCDIQATCGGMALCGTCRVEVLAGPGC